MRSGDEDEHNEAYIKEHLQLINEQLQPAAFKEEMANVNSNILRVEQINEQVREKLIFTTEELLDAKLKASEAEEHAKKVIDELSLTKEELVQKMSKIESNTEQIKNHFERS